MSTLVNFDIIISTYATVAAEFGRGASNLYRIKWFRIVLDEAHSIQHQWTKQYRAVAALSASFRWCLTGTPIQNGLDDLGALIQFLRVPLLDNRSSFRNHIVRLIESGKAIGFTNLRALLKSICLRRTKALLHLSEPEIVEYVLELSPEEDEQYRRISHLEHRRLSADQRTHPRSDQLRGSDTHRAPSTPRRRQELRPGRPAVFRRGRTGR
ncbi:hypothetical protein VTN77DRAFT_2971 [Rasamsonia byssochlamydoides]|uniref:uncharacterized protein n=1 Tax=Rasamsonia byssochlamydoides TaxID=89139 RepID=UPI003742A49E